MPLPEGALRRRGTPPMKAPFPPPPPRRVSFSRQRLSDCSFTWVTEAEEKRNLTRRRQIFCVRSSSGVLWFGFGFGLKGSGGGGGVS